MMNRAWSTIEIKSIDEATRTFEGIASTPRTDRVEDTVNPMGAEFKLPLTMMWQHGKGIIKDPIGWITHATPNKDGIPIRGQIAIPKDDYPQPLKDELNGVWVKVRDKIVRGLSIGFRPLESEPIKGSFGMNFKRWEWLELSPVGIPANAEATITSIKQYDQQQRATGDSLQKSVRLVNAPAVAGKTSVTKGIDVKTYTEQIKDLEATRAAKAARMEEVMSKSLGEGRSTEGAEGEEFDNLDNEIKQIDADLVRLHKLETMNASKAKPVDAKDTSSASDSRSFATVKTVEKLEPGIRMARFALCLAAAKGDLNSAFQISQTQYPNDDSINAALKGAAELGSSSRLIQKVVAGGTTVGTTWAAPLLAYNQFAGDFIEFLRPMTIIGKFGTGGVPSLRRIPFNVHIRGQTSGGTGYWVGEGAPKPVTLFGFSDVYLGYTKVANIAVITEELIRFSDPSAEVYVRDALAAALIERLDTDFVDPTKTLSAAVSPASITNGAPNVTSGGNTAALIRADIAQLWSTAIAANLPLSSAVYITDAATALGLSLLQNPLGQPEFPGVGMNGGTFMGVPMIVSNYLPTVSSGSMFILAFASEIFIADDGQVSIVASREASIQMDASPTNNSATGTGTSLVSMFQTDSVALRAERFVNWQKRRTAAVAYITGVDWGG